MHSGAPKHFLVLWHGDAIFFALMTSFDKLSAPALANTAPISTQADIRISARQKQSKFSVCT